MPTSSSRQQPQASFFPDSQASPYIGAHFAQEQMDTSPRQSGPGRTSKGKTALIAIVSGLVCLLVGAALGLFLLPRVISLPQGTLPAAISEDQLDATVGTYTYDGSVYKVSARQAILDAVSLDSVSNGDGTYKAPTADMVLAYARNQILTQAAAQAGIAVTDDDLTSYLQEFAGSTDISAIAARFEMEPDQARRVLIEAAAIKMLRDKTVGVLPDQPDAPQEPADGDTEVANETYAQYIIGLLGGYWDSSTGTWADTNNAFYQTLKEATFSQTGANYEAAQLAYSVAADDYTATLSSSNDQWTTYVNDLMSKAAITISTLQA